MTTKVFSIKDSKAGIFMPPFLQNSHGEAERTFNKYTHKSDSMISQYPDDYDLYFMGDFDDNTGKFDLLPAPQHIVNAAQIKTKRNEAAALNS